MNMQLSLNCVVYDGDDDEEIYEYVEVVGVNAKKIM
jgi:hypothetical protein